MGSEQSTLRFLPPIDPNEDPNQSDGADTSSSNSIPSNEEGDVSGRMNHHPHPYEDNNSVFQYCVDNNDISCPLDEDDVISVEYISNCQEDSEIQLEESIDNNSNISEEMSEN